MPDFVVLRDFESPVTPEQLQPLHERCRCVQFCHPLTDDDHKAIAEFLRPCPHVPLRAYGPYFPTFDLDWLRHYPSLRHLEIDVLKLDNLDGLQHVSPDLETFGLGPTQSKRHSLAVLRRFPHLRTLYLEGQAKDIEVIGTLVQLDHLLLRSITLPDLSILRPLKQLRSLEIKLGGTKDLALLPEIGRLRYLELWMIRGLSDLESLGSVRTLQYLFLQALKNVKALPSLAGLPLLRRICLENMKGLTDLRPVADAPALEDLIAVYMGHLTPEAFRPFVGHPTLRRHNVGLGSDRRNKAVEEMLPFPLPDGKFTFRDDGGVG